MPVPNEVIFGPGLNSDGGVNYQYARELVSDSDKLNLLKRRLDTFMISQIEGMAKTNDEGKLIIVSPFPLIAMTCMASETLGRITNSIPNLKSAGNSDNQISRIVSISIYNQFDHKLSRQLTKPFKSEMAVIWPNEDIKALKSYSEVIYIYLRNSFNHGYQSKNVFLNHLLEEGWKIEKGFLQINPYWFWKMFKLTFDNSFEEILDERINNSLRINALNYFHELIN